MNSPLAKMQPSTVRMWCAVDVEGFVLRDEAGKLMAYRTEAFAKRVTAHDSRVFMIVPDTIAEVRK